MKSSFLVNLETCRLIAGNFTTKLLHRYILSSPHAPPMCFDLKPTSNFEEHLWPLPPLKWGGGRGWGHSLSPCSQHLCALWTVGNPDTTVQLAQSLPPYLWYARSCSAQIKFGDLGWAVYAQQPYLPELPYKFKLYVVCSYLPDFIKLQQLLLKTFFLTNLWLKRKFFQST